TACRAPRGTRTALPECPVRWRSCSCGPCETHQQAAWIRSRSSVIFSSATIAQPNYLPKQLLRIQLPLARDREQLRRYVVDLERCVLDAKALAQHSFELASDRVAVGVRRDEHVRREYRDTWRQLPQVQIVHLAHECRVR